MADIRIKDLNEAAVPGGDYFLLTDSAADGPKKIKPSNIVTAADLGAATLAGAQTLTNKTISGSSNTLTNIPNSALTNSSITISGTAVPLGGSKNLSPSDLGTVADSTILSNISGSLASASANTIASVIDKQLGITRGSIAYRGAAGWTSVPPGVSGQYLKTLGPGTDPIFDTPAGGGNMLGASNLADVADSNAALINLGAGPTFDTKALASAYAPSTAPNHIRIAGYASAGDGGGAVYVKVGSAPAHQGKFSITLKDGVTVVWYALSEANPRPETFGAAGDGSTDDTTALAALLVYAPAGATIDLHGKSYKYTTLTVSKSLTILNGSLLCAATTGVQITVDPSARLTARRVKFTGGGTHTTADTNQNHSLISQIGASTTSRGVGLDLEGCEFSGCGYVSVLSKFCDRHRFVDNKFSDFAYAGFMVLSCNDGLASGNRVEGQDAVGLSGDAYGFSITHWSAGYNVDPNAGTPLATNPFSNGWRVIGNTVIAPKKWEGIDFHGGYNNVVAFNKVYGAQTGILLGTGSGDAANYAGYTNIITGNIVSANNEDGTTVSGLLTAYGIVVNGGSAFPHNRIVVTGNIIDGYGGNYAVTVPAIRIDSYAKTLVVTGNVITGWSGTAISVSQGAGSAVINDNMFSGMRDTQASSAVIRFQSDSPGRYSVMGNVLGDDGNAPPIGLVTSSTVQARITYGSDFRRAATEVAASFTSPGEIRKVTWA